jgi:hypothetical protein
MKRLIIAAVGLASSQRMTPIWRRFSVIILALAALFAGGCRLLGVAELTPMDPESEPSVITLRIFEGDPGDSWPREGEVLFWVSGSQVPIESLDWFGEGAWGLYLYGGDDVSCSTNILRGPRVTLWEADYYTGNVHVPWTAEDASDGRVDINLFAVLPKIFFTTKNHWALEAEFGLGDGGMIYCGPASWVS